MDKPSHSFLTFWFLFVVSFFEGGAVMAVELVGAKMVGPYYGNSLYVWAAVLALTLGGLTTGYFFGGIISKRYPNQKTLYLIMLVSALLVALMPLSSEVIMEATLGLKLQLGITISCLVFLFPPLVCFGMVSPLIVRLVTTHEQKIGHAAGTVYAISTVGGIIVTFFVGFYAIPYIGLAESAFATAVLLGVFPAIYFLSPAQRKPA